MRARETCPKGHDNAQGFPEQRKVDGRCRSCRQASNRGAVARYADRHPGRITLKRARQIAERRLKAYGLL